MEEIRTGLPDRIKELSLYLVVAPADKLPKALVEQLLKKSQQEHVAELDSQPGKRFENLESYQKWSSGGNRIVYLLVEDIKDNPTPQIAGVVWFGQKTSNKLDSKYNVTFAIRLYKEYLGKGLSGPLMQATHKDIGRFYPGCYIWLETDDDNIPAKKAYESLGYEYANKDGNRLTMIYPNELRKEA